MEASDLGVGTEDVEAGDGDDGDEHGARDVPLGMSGLLAQVRRGLESGEQQHAVEHTEQHTVQALWRGAGGECLGDVVLAADLDDHDDEEDQYHAQRDQGQHELRPGGQGHPEIHDGRDQDQQQDVPPVLRHRFDVEFGLQGVGDRAADHDQDAGTQGEDADVVEEAGRGTGSAAEPVRDIVIEGAGGLNALGVLGDDPAEAEHADRGDEHRQRRCSAGALARGVEANE